jgi:hypothetical protein
LCENQAAEAVANRDWDDQPERTVIIDSTAKTVQNLVKEIRPSYSAYLFTRTIKKFTELPCIVCKTALSAFCLMVVMNPD